MNPVCYQQDEDWQDFECHDEPIIPFIPNELFIISDLEESLSQNLKPSKEAAGCSDGCCEGL